MAFDEVRFPESIAYGSIGGPRFFTTVKETRSGREYRNANWQFARHRYRPIKEALDSDQIADLRDFFMARWGMYRGFRFKDLGDFVTTDKGTLQAGYVEVRPILTAIPDTNGLDYQLVKYYESGPTIYTRPIYKPVNGTLRVYINSILQASGWTCDYTSGVLTFTSPPGSNIVTAYFEFDVPCRFNTDDFEMAFEEYDHHAVEALEIIETRDID